MKKILYIISFIVLTLSMLTASILLEKKINDYRIKQFNTIYINDYRNYIYKDPNLSLNEIKNKMEMFEAYDGYQYANISFNADIRAKFLKTDGKVTFVTDDILRKNLWTISAGNGENLLSQTIDEQYEPILIGGEHLNKIKLNTIINFTISSDDGTKTIDIKGKVVGKLNTIQKGGFSIPEYEARTDQDLSKFFNATIVMKESEKYAEFFANRENKLVIFNKENSTKAAITDFKNTLQECGAVDNTQLNFNYTSLYYINIVFICVVIVSLIFASVLTCISINYLYKNIKNRIISSLITWFISVIINFITMIILKISIIQFFTLNILWLIPLVVIVIYTVVMIFKLLLINQYKEKKGVSYEKI